MNMDFQQEMQTNKLQALGHLAGGMAHDFNNILSVIEGYARILNRQIEQQDPMHEKIDHILAATQRGASLTRQLLAFSSQRIMPQTSCDILQTIHESEILLRSLLPKNIRLTAPPADEALYVPCDSDTLNQILINLTVNARDAMPFGGTITLAVTSDENSITLRFTDSGAGMPSDILMKIFDPFFTTKEQGKGTGLGLSTVDGFMRQIGGSVRVASKENSGTVFFLHFPRAFPDNKTESRALFSKHGNPSSLIDKTILVIDDEEALLPIIEEQLQEIGLKVLKAANADAALIMQEDYPDKIDLVLTDVVMPGLNGVRFSQLLKSLRPDIGVVFMTGYPNRADLINHASPLPDDALVIPKPLKPENLSPALLAALERVHDM